MNRYMELRQLRYLAAVAELGSFSAAARRLHVVQPAISQQIRKLETELGVELILRGSTATLTAAGEQVCRRARTALAEVDSIAREAAESAETVSGRLTIGAMQWLGTIDLPALLAAFAEQHPGVAMTLREAPTPHMIEGVRRGELDVSFVSLLDASRPRGCEAADLGSEELLICGAAGLLPPKSSLRVRFLHDRPFVAFAEGSSIRAIVDAALRRHGIQPRVMWESNEPFTVRDLAARGLGFTVVPRSFVEAPGPPLEARSARPTAIVRHLSLVWRANREPSRAARRFIAAVQDHCAMGRHAA
ncbi:MAG: LysR family transcriptional regulator [Conexibacter sp.]